MKLNVVGLQSGPTINKKGYEGRIGQLSVQFDLALKEAQDTDLIVFPELMTIPYFCSTNDQSFFELAEPLQGKTFQHFSQKAKTAGVNVIITIFEKEIKVNKTSYYNTAIVISKEGEMIGFYRKTHIPKFSLPTLTTDETLYFDRGTKFPVFTIKGIKVGILICFDRSFPEAARVLALQGAEVIVIPTAAGGEERKGAWLAECQSRARENGLYVIGINKAGKEIVTLGEQEIQSQFFGMSCTFDPNGQEVVPHLNDKPWKNIKVEIDSEKIIECRSKLNFLDFLQIDLYHSHSDELSKVRNYQVNKEETPLFEPKGVTNQ